jgi:hypothetical protein
VTELDTGRTIAGDQVAERKARVQSNKYRKERRKGRAKPQTWPLPCKVMLK